MTRFLKEKLGLDWVDERSVARAYGVMKTNAMGLKDQGGQALFPIASLMSHNCVSNLEVVGEPGKTVLFRAKRRIKEGEELVETIASLRTDAENIRIERKAIFCEIIKRIKLFYISILNRNLNFLI